MDISKRHSSMLGVALLAVLSFSCVRAGTDAEQFMAIGTERIASQALAVAVTEYYKAESRRDWPATYNARSKGYQRLVPVETYKRDMEKGMADWKLLQIEVVDSRHLENGDTEIRIRFKEKFGPQAAKIYLGGRVSSGVNIRIETTKWRQVDNRWICIDAAQRGHLPY